MNWNWNFIYNIILILLSLEEIVTAISSIFMRSFANIFLQIYPGLILIGNLGEILRFISRKIIFCGINVSEEKKVFLMSNNISIIYVFNSYIRYFLLCR